MNAADKNTFTVITSEGRRSFDPQAGYVLPHEHMLIDMRVYWEGDGPWDGLDSAEQSLTSITADAHRRLPQGTSRENLVLADWYVGALELRMARDNGCQLIVDLTTSGLSPQPASVVKSCHVAGVPVVLGVGRYLGHAIGEEDVDLSVLDLTELWLEQARNGIDGHQVGIIGEIGTSAQISATEEISLRASAGVQAETDLPLNIHVDPFGRQGHNVLDILEQEGADLSRVALSHCDGDIDVDWLASLAERGAYVEFDLFGTGSEWSILGRGFNTDADRMRAIGQLVERGLAERVLMSHDICMKNSLVRYGGWGYGHLGRRILPALDDVLGEDTRMLLSSSNPLRFLSCRTGSQ